jgi:hypothetical protein
MASDQGWATMRGEALRPSTQPGLDDLLLRLGMPGGRSIDRNVHFSEAAGYRGVDGADDVSDVQP